MWISIRSLTARAIVALELAAALALVHMDVQLRPASTRREGQRATVVGPELPVTERPRSLRLASPAGLSPREVEVLHLLAAGKTNREIAAALVVSVRTVDHHLAKIYRKT